MRGITSIEAEVLEDSCNPPLTEEEWQWTLNNPGDDSGGIPDETFNSLVTRGCITKETRTDVEGDDISIYHITSRGRDALRLYRMGLVNG